MEAPVGRSTAWVERPKATVRTASGRVLAYSEAGSGPDVLLIHGTLTTADDMSLALFDALEGEFHVVAVDRPSHGASDRDPWADASVWSQAETILDAAFALGMDRPLVVGHSSGGAVALAMAAAHPARVSGVVALAPICFPELRLETLLFGSRAATIREAGSLLDPMLLPILWNAMFLPQAMPERFARGFPFSLAGRPEQTVAEGENAICLGFDLVRSVASYATCRVPTRFLVGSADIVVNPFHSTLASAMMPNATLGVLRGVGHMLHHAKADAVADAVRSLASTSDQ